ncbi:hypothetical protein ABZ883_20600 [Streptomyces sp. NPDC046977]|uniref:hypothetical protein n=1 Tax=Streptomyces sp. NPDC046977 TaxID=3154703 RepID=UPI00340FC32C
MKPTPLPRRRAVVWQSLAFMTALYGLLIGGLTLWVMQLPRSVGYGECEGIGFGCTLSPHETWVVFVVPVLRLVILPVALLASTVMLGYQVTRRQPKSAWTIGTMSALTGWLAGPSVLLLLSIL